MEKQDNYYKLKVEIESAIEEYKDDPELGPLIKGLQTGVKDGQIILTFEGDVGTKYRIAIPYLGKMYVVCWFKVSADGSIYFGIRDKDTEKRRAGKVTPENGLISINVNEEYLPPLISDGVTKDRFSFHGSGEIHDLDESHTTFRPPIRELQEQSELFWVLFKEISKFDDSVTLKKNDISIITCIEEKHALFLHTLIAPSDKTQLQAINDGKNNFFLVVDYHGIDNVGDLTLQFVFAPSPTSECPERTVVIWPTINS